MLTVSKKLLQKYEMCGLVHGALLVLECSCFLCWFGFVDEHYVCCRKIGAFMKIAFKIVIKQR